MTQGSPLRRAGVRPAQRTLDELNAAAESVRRGTALPKDALDAVTQRLDAELASNEGKRE